MVQIREVKQRKLRAHLSHRVQALRALWHATLDEGLDLKHVKSLDHLVGGMLGTAGTLGLVWANDSLHELARVLADWLATGVVPSGGPRLLADLMEGYFAGEARYLEEAPEFTYALSTIRPPLPAPEHKGVVLGFEQVHEEGDQLQVILESDGFATQILRDPDAFLEAALANPGAVLLVEIMQPDASDPGIGLVNQLRKDHARNPKVIFTSLRGDFQTRLAAVRVGGLYYFQRPLKHGELLLVLDEIVAQTHPRPYRLLMVEDDRMIPVMFRRSLEAAGIEFRVLANGARILEEMQAFDPELILMDIGLPGCSGVEVAAILRQHAIYRDLPLIFLSAESDPEQQIEALAKGGEDFLQKPIHPDHLLRQILPRLVKRRDIVLSRVAEKRERMEQAQLRGGLDVHALVSVTDRVGRILYANDNFCRICGFSRSELLGQTHRIIKSAAHPPGFFGEMWQTISAGSIWRGEIQNRKKSGDPYWVETTIVPILGPNRRPERYIAIGTDATFLHEALAAAKVSEEHVRRSQIYTSIGTWEWDIQTGELYWSERVPPLFGYPQEEMETTYENLLKAVHPEDRQTVIEAVNACVEQGVDYDIEHRVVWANGTIRWVHEFGVVMRDEDETPLHMQGVVQDVTARKQAEAEQKSLQVQLNQSQKMESLGTLAGGIAHDINNVLGAILGLASAHIGTQPYGSPLHQALGTICKATERGGKMVKSLLGFARQSPDENKELDMNAILREQVSLLERTTLAKVRLEMNLEAELQPLLGDASALTHALMNLCVNAVDAMPVNGTLTLHTRNVDNDWIEVVVEDNGMGMPKEVLEKALDPFFTTKGIGKGTGLGLSMVFSTVKAHRGQMDIESEPDKGTRVRLRFPACEPEAPVQTAAPTVAEATLIPHGTLKVLLVDDDDLIQSSVQMILEVLGHRTVATAQSGEEALAMLVAGFEPDLVILDMNMPGLGGAGTLPRLRGLCPAVPVLLSTGRTDQTALTLASAHPGVTLLSKPFGLRELQRCLESIGLG